MRGGVAVVTGASRGIGRAIARRLAADGWPVGVNYRSDEAGAKETCALIDGDGGHAVLAPGDVSRRDDVEAIFATAELEGPVAVLVNNAGVRRDALTVLMTERDWEEVLGTNLTGAFLACRRAVRSMLPRRWGRIVNVVSVVGLRGNAGQANYAAAKAGLVALTRTLAREVAAKGITVNALAPGLVTTAMTDNLPPQRLAALVAETPLGRPVTCEEVAAAVAFLAGTESSGVCGQVLCVDGGMTA